MQSEAISRRFPSPSIPCPPMLILNFGSFLFVFVCLFGLSQLFQFITFSCQYFSIRCFSRQSFFLFLLFSAGPVLAH